MARPPERLVAGVGGCDIRQPGCGVRTSRAPAVLPWSPPPQLYWCILFPLPVAVVGTSSQLCQAARGWVVLSKLCHQPPPIRAVSAGRGRPPPLVAPVLLQLAAPVCPPSAVSCPSLQLFLRLAPEWSDSIRDRLTGAWRSSEQFRASRISAGTGAIGGG